LNVSHLIMFRKVNFYRHLYTSKIEYIHVHYIHSCCDVVMQWLTQFLVTSSLLYRQYMINLRRM